MGEESIWNAIHDLRETCQEFLDLPAPGAGLNDDREDDERVFGQQVEGAVTLLAACTKLLAIHTFGLHPDSNEGGD